MTMLDKMVSDQELNSIIRNVNTDLKVSLQALMQESDYYSTTIASNMLVELIESCVNSDPNHDVWIPSQNIVLPLCKEFAQRGIFEQFTKEGAKIGEARYYFSLSKKGKKFFRPLALKALETIHDSNTSFFSVFGCYGGGCKSVKGGANRFKALLAFYPLEVLFSDPHDFDISQVPHLELLPEKVRDRTGLPLSTFFSLSRSLYEDGIIQSEGEGNAYTYRVNRSFSGYFKKEVSYMQKMLRRFEDLHDKRVLAPGAEFDSPTLYKQHFSRFNKHWFNYTIREMANKGYLERVTHPKKLSKLRLSEDKGRIIANSFVLPLFYVLTGKMLIEELDENVKHAPFEVYSLVRKAITLYSEVGPNIIKPVQTGTISRN